MFRRTIAFLCAIPKDPHKVLGVPYDASEDIIRKAHRKFALKYHPDNSETGDKERFQEVQAAFDALKHNDFKPIHVERTPMTGDGRSSYDTPGSTQDNYVKGKNAAYMRIMLVWCAAFVTVRWLLWNLMPPTKRRIAVDTPQDHAASTERSENQQPSQSQRPQYSSTPFSFPNASSSSREDNESRDPEGWGSGLRTNDPLASRGQYDQDTLQSEGRRFRPLMTDDWERDYTSSRRGRHLSRQGEENASTSWGSSETTP